MEEDFDTYLKKLREKKAVTGTVPEPTVIPQEQPPVLSPPVETVEEYNVPPELSVLEETKVAPVETEYDLPEGLQEAIPAPEVVQHPVDGHWVKSDFTELSEEEKLAVAKAQSGDILTNTGFEQGQVVGGADAQTLAEQAALSKLNGTVGLSKLTNAALFGFGPKLMELMGNGDEEAYRTYGQMQAEADPNSALAGDIVGAVAGPGLGAGALIKGAGKLGAKLGITGAQTTARVAAGSATGVGFTALSNVAENRDLTENAGLGAALGAVIPTIGSSGNKLATWIKSLGSKEADSVERVLRSVSEQTSIPIEDLVKNLESEKDFLKAMVKMGISPEDAASAISKTAYGNDYGGFGRASALANDAKKSIDDIQTKANSSVREFTDPLTATVKTPSGNKLASEAGVGEAYRMYDGDALDKAFADMTFGDKSNTYGQRLKEAIVETVNLRPRDHLLNTTRKLVSVDNINIDREGRVRALTDEAKELTSKDVIKASKEGKTIITVDGRNYLDSDENFDMIHHLDGTILQKVDDNIGGEVDKLVNSSATTAGADLLNLHKDTMAGLKKGDDGLAQALDISATTKGQLNVMSDAEKLISKSTVNAQDFDKSMSKIDAELGFKNKKKVEATKPAVQAAIQAVTAKGERLKGLLNNSGKISDEYTKYLETNGFSKQELSDYSYLDTLTGRVRIDKPKEGIVSEFVKDAAQRAMFQGPQRAIVTSLLVTLGRKTPFLSKMLSKYDIKDGEIARKLASLNSSETEKLAIKLRNVTSPTDMEAAIEELIFKEMLRQNRE
jgi:hypothetical protein